MKFAAKWGREPRVEFESSDDLDEILDRVRPAGQPLNVSIYALTDATFPPTLQIGVGHPARSFISYIDVREEDESGWAVDPTLPELDDVILFDVGGEPTDIPPARTRVTPDSARHAAREFVTMGRRPSNVDWVDDEN